MFTCTKRSPQQQCGQLLTVVAVPWTLFFLIVLLWTLHTPWPYGWVTHGVGNSSLHTSWPDGGLHMLSALTVHSQGWFFFFCLFIVIFCSVRTFQCRVPFILHLDRLVRVVSAAVIPGSSSFFNTSGLFALLRLPVLLSLLFLSGADGCPHTVVVLQFHFLCFCATAADLFFGPTSCFMVILSLDDFACLLL